ncbi:amino acid transporter AVT1E [Trichonephila clavata]|uniref:Amino acid transporter AVT1E n=1 Tax=Trichonephila clavata TaxID=2740835 RepID=A0A8X6LFI9_TRICU|nr:amino acid transporter AVT1E [Trichonephila clavata]
MVDTRCSKKVDDKEKKENENRVSDERKGLSLWLASVFIVGQMAGSGVLALPDALLQAGWSGIPLLIFCCINSLYAGICLGRSWSILEERYDEYKGKIRYPYPAIAYRAFGKRMQYFVSFCIDVNLFGVSIVFLLLSSQLITSVAKESGVAFCYWILILALFLCPLMWLGTPDDFWPAAIIALGSTITACILLIVLIAKDSMATSPEEKIKYPPTTLKKFFLAFGTIYFSFGGAASFPTFQNDMKNRNDFPKAATMGFAFLILLYLPVAVLGYVVYGDKVQADIIDSISPSTIKSIIQVLLALHMLFAFLLVINASSQEFEEFFKVPNKFGWKRIAIRSSMMLFIVFVAQSVPKFGKVLNLVGGSAVTLTASVFPCIFYYRLCSQTDPNWPERNIPVHEKIYLIVIIVCGIVGGGISTYAAMNDIAAPESFNPPCYVNLTAADNF